MIAFARMSVAFGIVASVLVVADYLVAGCVLVAAQWMLMALSDRCERHTVCDVSSTECEVRYGGVSNTPSRKPPIMRKRRDVRGLPVRAFCEFGTRKPVGFWRSRGIDA